MVGLEMIPVGEAVVLAAVRAVMGDRTHRVETEEMAILAMGPFPVAIAGAAGLGRGLRIAGTGEDQHEKHDPGLHVSFSSLS